MNQLLQNTTRSVSLGTYNVALVTDPSETLGKVSVNAHFAQRMDLHVQFSLEGTTKKGYNTNISCYVEIGVYMGIKLKGDEDVLVEEF